MFDDQIHCNVTMRNKKEEKKEKKEKRNGGLAAHRREK